MNQLAKNQKIVLQIMPLFNKNHIIFIALLFLMGCSYSEHPMGKPLPNLSYENLNPYSIHGGSVVIQQSFVPDEQTKRLSAELPVAPDKLIRRYANRRFVTAGLPTKLIFDIQNATLTKAADEENIVGFLSGAAEDYYKLSIFITMTPVRADGQRAAPFTIKLNRQLVVPQNTSLAEREFRQFELLEKTLSDIDRTVSDMVQNKMTLEYF